jgi:hypothetical protein
MDPIKSTTSNINILQQNILLKFKDLYAFLVERHSEVAYEIRATYVSLANGYYSSLFEKYVKALNKLQVFIIRIEKKTVIADKLDLIGCEEGVRRGLFGSKPIKDKTSVFTLGDRIQILLDSDPGIIIPYVAEDKNLKYPFEAAFKSLCRLVLDNASSEYLFTIEFFIVKKDKKKETPGAAFKEIFETTIGLVQLVLKQFIDNAYDAIGVLICIRLNAQNLRIMQKRRIPALDGFMNATNMLLWPKFQSIMDLHMDSLKNANLSKLLPTKDVRPHYISRRYSELSVSLLTLNQGFEDSVLSSRYCF